jgi:TetR/AcrR family transcriptional regulator, transcriptional repressor for nem operon
VARAKEFDEEEVVVKVMKLFWQRGYANTSIKDIVNETQVQPGSLYAFFGNKEELFRKALKRYTREFLDDTMPQNLPPLKAIHLWLEHLIKVLSQDTKHKRLFIKKNLSSETT